MLLLTSMIIKAVCYPQIGWYAEDQGLSINRDFISRTQALANISVPRTSPLVNLNDRQAQYFQ